MSPAPSAREFFDSNRKVLTALAPGSHKKGALMRSLSALIVTIL